MDSFKAVCPHRSIPVETDDSMTESSLDLVWPSCQSCQGQGEEPSGSLPDPRLPRPEALRGRPDPGGRPVRLGPEPPFHRRPATYLEVTESCRPADNWSQAWAGAPDWDPAHHRYHDGGRQGSWNVPQENSVEEMESLETPLPLMSDFNNIPCSPAQHPANTPRQAPALGTCVPPCRRRPPVDEARHGNCSHHRQSLDPHGRHRQRQPPSWNPAPPDRLPPLEAARTPAVIPPPRAATPGGLMGEVSVETSQGTAPRPRSGETRRTVSLPEECRNVFITYSVDTAQEMIPFTKFLTGQGFKAAIDIFDNPVRRMDITKWMDSFLKDKSVLIIVVISPRYKEDVDGDREDEHGLHTKYIHNQIQNEFIQQRCLNFRLVPVLFPAASKKHVPSWLQSTRLYRWPQDTQDLLLRLLREERYVTPPLGRGLTLTVRPL